MFSSKRLAALVLSLVTTPAAAFTLLPVDPDVKGWNTKELQFHLNPENCPDNVGDIIKAALTLWNTVPTSSVHLSRGADTTQTLAEAQAGEATDVPAIFCSPSFAADGTVDPDDIPGFATGAGVTQDHHLAYGYLLLNVQPGAAANITTMPETLVKVVIAHEVGHVLGLGHSEDSAALMYYDGTNKKSLALAADDVEGLTYLYPRDELGPEQPFGCGTVGTGGGKGTVWATLALLLCAPAYALRVARKRSSES